MCARAILETGLAFEAAVAQAHRQDLAWIIVVKGPLGGPDALVLHDVDGLTGTESSLEQLDRLAREESRVRCG